MDRGEPLPMHVAKKPTFLPRFPEESKVVWASYMSGDAGRPESRRWGVGVRGTHSPLVGCHLSTGNLPFVNLCVCCYLYFQ